MSKPGLCDDTILLLNDDRKNSLLEPDSGGDRFFALSQGTRRRFFKLKVVLLSRQARGAHHNDESNVRTLRGREGGNRPAFTVPDEPDTIRVDALERSKKAPSGEHVPGGVFTGCLRTVAGRLADAALIKPQDGNPVAGQVIREHEKGTVLQDYVIAIVSPPARDQDDRRVWTARSRQG